MVASNGGLLLASWEKKFRLHNRPTKVSPWDVFAMPFLLSY